MTSVIHRCMDKPARLSVPVPVPRPAQYAIASSSYFSLDAHDRCAALPARQRETLLLMSKGLDQHGIAAAMDISVHTVREYKQRVLKALEVNSAVEAAVLAAKAGLV